MARIRTSGRIVILASMPTAQEAPATSEGLISTRQNAVQFRHFCLRHFRAWIRLQMWLDISSKTIQFLARRVWDWSVSVFLVVTCKFSHSANYVVTVRQLHLFATSCLGGLGSSVAYRSPVFEQNLSPCSRAVKAEMSSVGTCCSCSLFDAETRKELSSLDSILLCGESKPYACIDRRWIAASYGRTSL
jgi:hypothetical protein